MDHARFMVTCLVSGAVTVPRFVYTRATIAADHLTLNIFNSLLLQADRHDVKQQGFTLYLNPSDHWESTFTHAGFAFDVMGAASSTVPCFPGCTLLFRAYWKPALPVGAKKDSTLALFHLSIGHMPWVAQKRRAELANSPFRT